MMKSRMSCLIVTCMGLALTLCAGATQAALLNVVITTPVIGCDSNGQINFDASTGQFNVDANPVSIDFADGGFAFVDAPRALRIRLLVNSSGVASSNGSPDDLVIEGSVDVDGDGVSDYSGVLLTGHIKAFGFEASSANVSSFDYVFTATGGSMAGLFAGGDIGILQTSENSAFTGGFGTSFTGGAKGSVGVVPLAATYNITGHVTCALSGQGVPGAAITVQDSSNNVVGTTTTIADGSYAFNNLPAGTYTVTATAPSGAQVNGSNPLTVVLVDRDGVADFVVCPLIKPCETKISGMVTKPSCRCNDKPVANVTIEVVDQNARVVATTATAADGTYSVTGLPAGTYTVRIAVPDGYTACQTSSTITLVCGQPQVVNFKIRTACPPGSISGTVKSYCKPVPGVTVTLFDGSGAQKDTDVTDACGNYSFDNLPQGNYTVKITVPDGYDACGNTSQLAYVWSGRNTDVDFYLRPKCQPGSIIGTVKTSCQPTAGVPVKVYDGNGCLKGSDTTDCQGKYRIDNLPAGNYAVKICVPQGYKTVGDTSVCVSLASGETKTVDFALSRQCSTGKVTGTVKAGCKGVSCVTVKAFDTSGCLKGSDTTDCQGSYTICNLPAGNYTIKICVPQGYKALTDTSVCVGLSGGDTKTVNFGLSQSNDCHDQSNDCNKGYDSHNTGGGSCR